MKSCRFSKVAASMVAVCLVGCNSGTSSNPVASSTTDKAAKMGGSNLQTAAQIYQSLPAKQKAQYDNFVALRGVTNNNKVQLKLGLGIDTLINFVPNAFVSWASSQFLTLIGLTPASQTTAQLNQITGQLNTLQSEMVQEQAAIANLTSMLSTVQTEMQNNQYNNQAELLSNIETQGFANWNQFSYAVGNSTSDQLLTNTAALNVLAGIFNDSTYTSNLATVAAELSNSGGPNDSLNQTIPVFLTSMYNNLVTSMPTAVGTQSNDAVSNLDSYNESLMAEYYYIVSALQQIYTIEKTALYLQYNAPGGITSGQFKSVALAEPGLSINNSFTVNDQALDSLFNARFLKVQSLFASNIISDVKIGETNTYTPAKAILKDANGNHLPFVTGAWNQNCNLYIWQGLSGETAFKGSYNGVNLTAQCQRYDNSLASFSINLPTKCANVTSDNVTFYTGNDAGGNVNGQLQCSEINTNSIQPATNNFGYFINNWPYGYTPVGFYSYSVAFNQVNFNAYPNLVSAEPASTASPLGYNGYWSLANTNSSWTYSINNVNASQLNSPWEYIGPDGVVVSFIPVGAWAGQFDYAAVAIQCAANDPWCSQLQGSNPSSVSGGGFYYNTGSSAVCVGHHSLTVSGYGMGIANDNKVMLTYSPDQNC